MTSCYCVQYELHVLLEVKERKSCGLESLGLEEWAHLVRAWRRKALVVP